MKHNTQQPLWEGVWVSITCFRDEMEADFGDDGDGDGDGEGRGTGGTTRRVEEGGKRDGYIWLSRRKSVTHPQIQKTLEPRPADPGLSSTR